MDFVSKNINLLLIMVDTDQECLFIIILILKLIALQLLPNGSYSKVKF